LKGPALVLLGAVAAASASAATDAGAPVDAGAPPSGAPAGSGSARQPDSLVTVKTKVDLDTPKAIGTCDANASKDKVRIGLAHINDMQARYSDRIAGKSRYAYIAGYLKLLKTAQPTLVLDAGDDYEKGSLAELRSSGESTRQLIQSLPIDVRTFGNHDFAYGETMVLRDLRLSNHPVLAANVVHPGFSKAKQPFRPYARFDVGCVKIGVIGLVPQDSSADDSPNTLDDVFQQDSHYSAIVDREVKLHRSEVDILIAVTHLGYGEDLALARKPAGAQLDFIVGGHAEDAMKDPGLVNHPPGKTKTYIVQAGHFGEKIGHGEIVVNLKDSRNIQFEKYHLEDVDDKLPSQPVQAVDDLVKKLEDVIVPDSQKPIGKSNAGVAKGHPMVDLTWRAAKDQLALDVLVLGKDGFGNVPRGDVTLQKLYDSTNGMSAIWTQDIQGDEAAAMFRSFQPAGKYEWNGLTHFEPTKKYKIGFDKRTATYPKPLFGAASKSVHAASGAELIDVLEPWVRARTAKGQSID
jgi:2',3'-cyclic-nucleotide 2'-phosphodiesterase (5'-nucleotidase family)